jgi:hypothetical protein
MSRELKYRSGSIPIGSQGDQSGFPWRPRSGRAAAGLKGIAIVLADGIFEPGQPDRGRVRGQGFLTDYYCTSLVGEDLGATRAGGHQLLAARADEGSQHADMDKATSA